MRGLQKNTAGEQVAGQESPPDPSAKSRDDIAVPYLALRPKEAAKALGIGERLLWSKTNAGEIPHVRIGRAVVYPVDMLRDWLAEKARKGAGT